jgi:hypothetical protein
MLNGSHLAEFIRQLCRPKSGGTKMNTKIVRILLVVGVVAVALLVTFGFVSRADTPAKGNNIFNLKAPPFVRTANAAATRALSGTSFLQDEAGISAYTQTVGTIDLSIVRTVFRTIEHETTQYIIGSVELPDYPEGDDVHVYVHRDGWVVAYYLAQDPAAKIMDLRHYDGVRITNTKLENAMNKVLSAVGAIPFSASYYDFRYPNATNLMLIAEAYDTDDSFQLKLPNEFTFYERAWAHALAGGNAGYGGACSTLTLDSNTISSLDSCCGGWVLANGSLTPVQLPPGAFHTITVTLGCNRPQYGFGGVTLIYREVP